MHGGHFGIGRAGQKSEEICGHFAFFQFAHGGPSGVQPSEKCQGATLPKRKPDRMVARRTGAVVGFGKAGERHKAAMFYPKPALPMRGGHVAEALAWGRT